MKRKAIVESAAVLCMAGMLSATAISTTETDSNLVLASASSSHVRDNIRLAGIASILGEYEADWLIDETDYQVSIERQQIDVVGSTGVNVALIELGTEVTLDPEAIAAKTSNSISDVSTEGDKNTISDASSDADRNTISDASSDADRNTISDVSSEAMMKTDVDGDKKEDAKDSKDDNKKLTKEEKEWQKYLMADVNEYLNIRAGKSEESEIIGKLRKGDRAIIKKVGKNWTKIESGTVIGYVKNEYCVMGTDALKYAKKNCTKLATVTADGLRVREKQNTKSRILSVQSEDDILTVDTKTKTKKGWVAVQLDDTTAYVSSDYVKLSYKTTKAISIEEEQEMIRQKEAEEAAARAAAEKTSEKSSDGSSSSSSSTRTKTSEKTQGESLSASADDKTLLGALIYCEAGGESYECQVACGAVVINRIRSGSFPNNLHDVIYQRRQFGPVTTGKLERVLASGVSSTSMRAAEEALSGVDNTGGCLYFNDSFCGHDGLLIDTMVFW